MAKWKLNEVEIRSPDEKVIGLDIQSATHRTINGRYSRDYVGDEKKVIKTTYKSISKSDFDKIIAKRDLQISNGTSIRLVVNEDGFFFSGNVIIELPDYKFHIPNHYQYRNLSVTFIEV